MKPVVPKILAARLRGKICFLIFFGLKPQYVKVMNVSNRGKTENLANSKNHRITALCGLLVEKNQLLIEVQNIFQCFRSFAYPNYRWINFGSFKSYCVIARR